MLAALAHEIPGVNGPSITSVFLAHNKFYCREYVDPDTIPYAHINISASDLQLECRKALEKVGIPAFPKPNTGSGSVGICSIESEQDNIDSNKIVG